MRGDGATAFLVLATLLALAALVLAYGCLAANGVSFAEPWIDLATLVLLAATCAAAIWYGLWTRNMATKTSELAEATQMQVRAALAPLLEIPTTPANNVTCVHNRGGGPAHHLVLKLFDQDGRETVLCEGRDLHPYGVLRFETISDAEKVIRATYEDSLGRTHARAWRGVKNRPTALEVQWIDEPAKRSEDADQT